MPQTIHVGTPCQSYRSVITKTSPCNEHPLTPNFYIVKLGFAGVYIFLIFVPKHRLWVLVEAVLTCIPNQCFEQKIRKIFKKKSSEK